MKPTIRQLTPLDPILDLKHPGEFSLWIQQQRQSGLTYEELAVFVASIDDPAAVIRAAQLYASAGLYDQWLRCAGTALLSDDFVVRAHAMSHLAQHETVIKGGGQDLRIPRTSAAAPALERALETLRQLSIKTPFSVEAEVSLLTTLADIYVEHRSYQQSSELASEAVLLSKWLQVSALTRNARLIYALSSLRLENLDAALTQYEIIVQADDASPMHKMIAQVNRALIWLRNGDDELACNLLEELLIENPNRLVVTSTLQYARAVGGFVINEEVLPCPSGNYDVQVQAFKLLCANEYRPTESELRKILDLFREWRPNSTTLTPAIEWFQSIALLRLGQPLLAAQRVRFSTSKMPDLAVLLLGLKLEIALHIDGEDIEPIPRLCEEIKNIFDNTHTLRQRTGLARRLALWHPTAAAFLAFSPYSIAELVDVSSQSVLKDARPISVYGQGIPSRIPFVQMSLEAFGINSKVQRDQHVEKDRLSSVLLIKHGTQLRWLPVVSPALLVYNLIRVSENSGHAWYRAALELSRTNGLVPRTHGGYLRPEREFLQKLLEQLCAGHINIPTFKVSLRQYIS
jgi:tetratricopeptide (TPR) repeat protein